MHLRARNRPIACKMRQEAHLVAVPHRLLASVSAVQHVQLKLSGHGFVESEVPASLDGGNKCAMHE